MRLVYKINFNSTAGYFKDIIDSFIKEFGINATCMQYRTFIVISCDDEQESIEGFFRQLETTLPLSIFLDKAEVVDFIDPALEPLTKQESAVQIGILPSQIIKIYNQSTDFEAEAKAIANNEIVSFETTNGLMKIALPTKENREILGNNSKLMVINLNAINDLLAVNQKDVQLLSSIERPLVKLKFNILKNTNQEYSTTNFVDTKLPCDEVEYKMATALRKEDINFVLYTIDAKQEELKVTYSDEQTIIVSGDKSLFPKYDYTLNEQYNSSKEYFEKNGGVFKATLSQFNKRLESAIGVYMSMKSDESAISVNIPSKGITPIIQVPNVMTDFDTCIEEIEGIDENTPRLIENYKKKYPECFENKPDLSHTDGFETILSLTAHLLGLKDANEFEAKALEFNAKSGINVDFVLAKIDGVNYLDYRRIVQSIMSYKMAGVENNMLAFSFYESLSEFISDNVSKIKSELDSNEVVLCGDLFANSTLLSKTLKALSAYNVMIPKEYPLDIE